jgi:hypothetical protein
LRSQVEDSPARVAKRREPVKIVQSFWSKPMLATRRCSPYDRVAGGWLHRRYHYMSWALSCLQLRRFYDEVELVTDRRGQELLVGRLGLPYTRVVLALDDLDGYPAGLWAVGKILSYQLQDRPFLHVDGDVYVFSAFNKRIEGAALAAQNVEKDQPSYTRVFRELRRTLRHVPPVMEEQFRRQRRVLVANAGILGGCNLGFLQEYCRAAFEFIDANLDFLQGGDVGFFNNIFEQYLFYCLARRAGVPVTYLLRNVDSDFSGLADFERAPSGATYLHAVGKFKVNNAVGEALSLTLLRDYPDYYFRIQSLMEERWL